MSFKVSVIKAPLLSGSFAVEAAAELLAPVFTAESEEIYGPADVIQASLLQRFARSSHLALAYSNDNLVAACCMFPNSGIAHYESRGLTPGFVLSGLGVSPEARGLGIASALVHTLVEDADFLFPLVAATYQGAQSESIFSSWFSEGYTTIRGHKLNLWRHPKSSSRSIL